MLGLVDGWWFRGGMNGLRLDVAASNGRAVGSYLRAGFSVVGEFWRDAPDLEGLDVSEPRFDFLRDHLCLSGDVPRIRFYWMESKR